MIVRYEGDPTRLVKQRSSGKWPVRAYLADVLTQPLYVESLYVYMSYWENTEIYSKVCLPIILPFHIYFEV